MRRRPSLMESWWSLITWGGGICRSDATAPLPGTSLFYLISLNGEDLRKLPLLARKEKLKRILPSRSPHVLYVDHSRGNGSALYRLACQLDLEGIVAKRADSRYEDNPNARNWIKIKIPGYSQKEGRGDLFKRSDNHLMLCSHRLISKAFHSSQR
jgi:hypothetical protein